MGLRAYSALVFGLTWVIGYCVLAPMAYFLVNWRYLMVATSAPALLIGILYMFIIPESFHFLVSRGKSDELKVGIWVLVEIFKYRVAQKFSAFKSYKANFLDFKIHLGKLYIF